MRDEIWRSMLDAEMNKRFYAALMRRALRKHRSVMLASAIATSVAAVNLASQVVGKAATLVLAVIAAVLTAIGAVWNFRDDIVETQKLYEQWTELSHKWDRLWNDYEAGDRNLDQRLRELEEASLRAIRAGGKFHDSDLVKEIMDTVERVRGVRKHGNTETAWGS